MRAARAWGLPPLCTSSQSAQVAWPAETLLSPHPLRTRPPTSPQGVESAPQLLPLRHTSDSTGGRGSSESGEGAAWGPKKRATPRSPWEPPPPRHTHTPQIMGGGCQNLTARVSQICSTVRTLPTVTSHSPASSSLPNPSLLPPSTLGCEQVSSSPRTHLGLSKCSPRKWVPELSLSIHRSFVFRSTLQKGRPFRDVPRGPAAGTHCFHCGGQRFDTWSGN